MPFHDDLVELSPDLPPDFDLRRFPVIAAHFFGVMALPSQAGAGELEAADVDEAA